MIFNLLYRTNLTSLQNSQPAVKSKPAVFVENPNKKTNIILNGTAFFKDKANTAPRFFRR